MRWNRRATSLAISVAVLLLAYGAFTFSQTTVGQLPATQSPANPQANAQRATPPLIMIDAAHGGADSGAVLGPTLLEKDVTLAFARRLRLELNIRGVAATLLRDQDTTLSTDQRAAIVNSAAPALYICMHASSQGKGARFFTAMLPTGPDSSGPFASWETAQAKFLPRSRWVQEQLSAAIQKTGFPSRSLTAPLRPLNNVTAPALAIEIGPTTSDVSQVASAEYQAMTCAALANAIAPIIPQLEKRGDSTP